MRVYFLIIFCLVSLTSHSQTSDLSLDEVIRIAKENNRNLKAVNFELDAQRELRKTSFDLPKTNLTLLYGQYNSFENDNNITITQTIPFTAFGSNRKLNNAIVTSSEIRRSVSENELVYQVRRTYYNLAYAYERNKLLLRQDSVFEGFLKSATLRYRTGETHLLEKVTAETQRNEIRNQILKNESQVSIYQSNLKALLNITSLPTIERNVFQIISKIDIDTAQGLRNPSLALMKQEVEVARSKRRLEVAKSAPDLTVGVFSQTLIGIPNESGVLSNQTERFTGFHVGLAIPLWFPAYHGRTKSAEFNLRATEQNYEQYTLNLSTEIEAAFLEYKTNKASINYYQSSALPNAELILKQATAAFREGEISYAEFLLGMRNTMSIHEAYLQTLNNYIQSVIYLQYLTGNLN